MERAYVTGGTGFVGSNIVKVFAGPCGVAVHCPVHRFVPAGDDAFTWERLDLLDTTEVRASVIEFEPDVIVHSMILNDFDLLYRDRELAWRAYVETTATLAAVADEVGAKMILVSTDWVFDGTQAGADENTPPNPVNYYGVLKAVSEQVVLHRAGRAAVARVSGVNGMHWARPDNPRSQDAGFGYFVASLVDALGDGRRFSVWEADDINMVATPSLASEAAWLMYRIAVEPDGLGIFHCCGSEAIGRMDLARVACEVFDLDPGLLDSGPPDRRALPDVPIPYDTSMTVRPTTAVLGHTPTTARSLLERFRLECETGVPAVEVGG